MATLVVGLVVLVVLALVDREPWLQPGTGNPEPAAASPPAAAAGPTPPATGVIAPTSTEPTSTAPTSTGSTPTAPRASALLADLVVRGRAPLTGYEREEFGQAWADVDRNGCDTRNDILRRDLDDVELKSGTRGCLVLAGTLLDPYSGETISFVRGPGTSARVQVDHVVSLADAWRSGAWRWDVGRRTQLANDPLNLLAVDGDLNQQKGASNAASWLPPDRGSWCGYASQQVAVKHGYGLSVTQAERDALSRALDRCPRDTLLADPGPVPLGAG